MNAQPPISDSPVTWRKPDGSVVSCFEKVKVLNENYAELQQFLQDTLDDAVLLGYSEAQIREALEQLLDNLQASVAEQSNGASTPPVNNPANTPVYSQNTPHEPA